MAEVTHRTRYAMKVPLSHEGSVMHYYVADCTCGWQSPLCQTEDKADAALRSHIEASRPRKRTKGTASR